MLRSRTGGFRTVNRGANQGASELPCCRNQACPSRSVSHGDAQAACPPSAGAVPRGRSGLPRPRTGLRDCARVRGPPGRKVVSVPDGRMCAPPPTRVCTGRSLPPHSAEPQGPPWAWGLRSARHREARPGLDPTQGAGPQPPSRQGPPSGEPRRPSSSAGLTAASTPRSLQVLPGATRRQTPWPPWATPRPPQRRPRPHPHWPLASHTPHDGPRMTPPPRVPRPRPPQARKRGLARRLPEALPLPGRATWSRSCGWRAAPVKPRSPASNLCGCCFHRGSLGLGWAADGAGRGTCAMLQGSGGH